MSRLLMLSAMLLCLSGCNGDSTGPGEGRSVRYVLRSLNGVPVPAIQNETANGRLEFLAGALRLNADNTFTDSTLIRVTPMFRGAPLAGGEIVQTYDVAWGIHRTSGDTVYLSSIRGERYFMVYQAAGTLVQELSGTTLQYRRVN